VNLLHLESSGSWGGQEYRTCLEINWLNANGHRAWLICDPTSEVLTKARELGTPVIPMSLKHRINPLVSRVTARKITGFVCRSFFAVGR
jgi:hypothetical protein